MARVQISMQPNRPAASRLDAQLALANISRIGDARGALGERLITDIVVPMAQNERPAQIDLDVGQYVISVAMPSGEQMTELLEVKDSQAIDLVLTEPVAPGLGEPARRDVVVAKTKRPPKPSGAMFGSLPQFRTYDAVRTRRPDLVSDKPVSHLSVGRRRALSLRAPSSAPSPRSAPPVMPRMVDVRAFGEDWRSPFVERYRFVETRDWLGTLRNSVSDGTYLTSGRVDTDARRIQLGATDRGEDADFGGRLDDGFPRHGPGQRYACSVGEDGAVRQLAVIPWNWSQGARYDDTPVAEVYQEWDPVTGSWNLRSAISDGRISSVLAFLTHGDLGRARHLVSESLEYLMAKVQNPYAAAAAGYVLIYSRNEDLEHRAWPEWLRNLAAWFPFLPDGQILLATLCLQRRRLIERAELPIGGSGLQRLGFAKTLLERALRAGIPVYSLGMRLLMENLEILQEEEDRAGPLGGMPVADALRQVRAFARCMKTVQSTTVLDLASLHPER